MNIYAIGILLVLAVILSGVLTTKLTTPSLFGSILFFLGIATALLISTERWINGANWIIGNAKDLIGMAEDRYDVRDTVDKLTTGDIDKQTAGSITMAGVGLIIGFRFITTVMYLLIGFVLGVIIKAWLKAYGISIGII